MRYLPRDASERLRALLRTFPAVLVHGPRQCGKSTLVQHALPSWKQLDLERGPDFRLLSADPDGFLAANPRQVVFDEAQRLPELFRALRPAIDRGRRPGRYVLLGSASPAILRSVSESLAGRIGILELTPFLARELAGGRLAEPRWFWGGYPAVLALRTSTQRREWLASYVETFLGRDLPALGYSLPVERLRKLWTMLAHVHGGQLTVSDLAKSLGVSSHTVAGYLDLFEGAFMLRRLQPHFANVKKRLSKSPKVYLRDTGLLHHLLDLRRPEELERWPRRGQSFEGLVIEELCTRAAGIAPRPYLAYWRTLAGAEVDLLIGDGRRLVPIEIKLGQQVDARDLSGLRNCMQDLRLKHGWIVYGGEQAFRLGEGIDVVPWSAVARGDVDFGLRGMRRK